MKSKLLAIAGFLALSAVLEPTAIVHAQLDTSGLLQPATGVGDLAAPSFGITGFGGGTQGSLIDNAVGAAVGGAAASRTTGLGAFGAGTAFGLGNSFGATGFGGGFGGFGGQNTQQETQTPIRFTLKLGFAFKRPSPEEVMLRIRSRITRIPLPAKFDSLDVKMDGHTAIVAGQVPNKDDAFVVEQLLLLEPGIDKVTNNLTFVSEEIANPSTDY